LPKNLLAVDTQQFHLQLDLRRTDHLDFLGIGFAEAVNRR
jgi:hypothetical protein